MGTFRQPPSPFIGGRQPLAPSELPPSITAVPEDNPPFGLTTALWAVLRRWQPDAIPPPRSVPYPQGLDDPPFGYTVYPAAILRSWQPSVSAPPHLVLLPQAAAAVTAAPQRTLVGVGT